jgi:DNA-binding XRE family transcriptional regulator
MPPARDLNLPVGEPSLSGTLANEVPRPQALFPAPRLRELRLERLLSQDRLAKQANVARESIINLEQGGVARADTVRKLAEALGVDIHVLMSEPPEG